MTTKLAKQRNNMHKFIILLRLSAWKTTKKLGMATAVSGGRTVAVARYSPVGNWLGEFKENVLPPKKGKLGFCCP